jgi:hypothetical protein
LRIRIQRVPAQSLSWCSHKGVCARIGTADRLGVAVGSKTHFPDRRTSVDQEDTEHKTMSLKKELTEITLGDGRVVSVTGEQMKNCTDLDTCTAYGIALQAKIDVEKGRTEAHEEGDREEEETGVRVRARAYRIATRASIDEEKGNAEARGRGKGEEEEGEEEEVGTVKKIIKKERPDITAVNCIEYWQGYGRLWTSEREDQEAESQVKEARREERRLHFVADAVGPAASLVAKLKRKWSTIFRRLPINYRLYEWVDPSFASQWKKSKGVVYLETSSPI